MRPRDAPGPDDAIGWPCEGATGVEGHWARLWTGLKAQDPPTKLQPEAWSLSVGIMFRVIVPQSPLTLSVHCTPGPGSSRLG